MAAIVSVTGEGSVIAWNSVVVAQDVRPVNRVKSFCKKLLVCAGRYNLANTLKETQPAGNLPGWGAYLERMKASFN